MYYLFKNKKVDKNNDDIIKVDKINGDEIIKVNKINEMEIIKVDEIKEIEIKEVDEIKENEFKEADEIKDYKNDAIIMPSLPIRIRKPIRRNYHKTFSLSIFSYKIIDASADNTLILGIGLGLGVGISIGVCLGALMTFSFSKVN